MVGALEFHISPSSIVHLGIRQSDSFLSLLNFLLREVIKKMSETALVMVLALLVSNDGNNLS